MAVNYDIALQDNDLTFQGGDLFAAESDVQHVIDTINAFPGWWKENIADGVGLIGYSKASTALPVLNRSIQVNLNSDGYRTEGQVMSLTPGGNLIINPNAVKI